MEKQAYMQEVKKASLEKLVHLIKICGFLTQTKVYLFGTLEVLNNHFSFKRH